MNFQEIMAALPSDVAASLQARLDAINISNDLSKSEVEELVSDAIKLTKLEVSIADVEKLRLVNAVLNQVPKAILTLISL